MKIHFSESQMRRTFKIIGADMEFIVSPLGVFLKSNRRWEDGEWRDTKIYSVSVDELFNFMKERG